MDTRPQHTEITFQLITEERKGPRGFSEQQPVKLLILRTGDVTPGEFSLKDMPVDATASSLIAAALASITPLSPVWRTGHPLIKSADKLAPASAAVEGKSKGGYRPRVPDKEFVIQLPNGGPQLSIRPLKEKLQGCRGIFESGGKLSINVTYQALARMLTTKRAYVAYDELLANDWRDALSQDLPARLTLPLPDRVTLTTEKMGGMAKMQKKMVITEEDGTPVPLLLIDAKNRGVYFGKTLNKLQEVLRETGTQVDLSVVDLCLEEPVVKDNPTWTKPTTLETLLTK